MKANTALTGKAAHVVIAGYGAAGAAAKKRLIALAREKMDPGSLVISIVEPRSAAQDGMGLAWSASSSSLLVNMPVHTICTDPAQRADIGERLGVPGDANTSDLFPPRRAVGDLLHADVLSDDADAMSAGVAVERVSATVTGVERRGSGVAVRLDSGTEILADAAILAIGNIASTRYSHLRGCSGYVPCGWEPERWRHTVPRNSRVMVVGSSVSAIDAALALTENGHCGPITFVSREGRLPGVRGRHDEKYQLRTFDAARIHTLARANKSGRLSWPEAKLLCMNEMFAAGVSPEDLNAVWGASRTQPETWLAIGLAECNRRANYFTVMKGLEEVMPDLWHALDDAGRSHFHARRLSDYARIAWPIAPLNGSRLYGLLRKGQLSVHGDLEGLRHEGGEFVATIAPPRCKAFELRADTVVNATGIGGRLEQMDSQLIVDLLRHGLAVPDDKFGGALSDFHTGRLLSPSGTPTGPVWATAGALTRGTRLLTNVLSEAAMSGGRAADAVLDYLSEVQNVPLTYKVGIRSA